MRPAAAILAAIAIGAAVVVAAPAAAKSKAADEPDLSGTYTITSGKLPNGSSYDGTLTIAPKTRMGGKHGSMLWEVTWNVSSAEQPVRGVGIFLNGAFIVAYGTGQDYGVSVYLAISRGQRRDWMEADDTQVGYWFKSTGASGEEGLRGDRDAWSGDYRLHGHNLADGAAVRPYAGNLSVTKSGEVLNLRWSGRYLKGKDKPFEYPGIGIEVPGFMAAQWNTEGNGGVGIYVFDGAEITGMFAEDGGLGQEKLAVPPDVAERVAPYLSR